MADQEQDPFSAYLLLRSLKTLALRIRQQNENALAIEGLVRYAIGIEDVDDLKVDLAQALAGLQGG
jgi:cystathionine beta-lyase/cystathionine gamma-synthase